MNQRCPEGVRIDGNFGSDAVADSSRFRHWFERCRCGNERTVSRAAAIRSAACSRQTNRSGSGRCSDSPLEEDRLELPVPPKTAELLAVTLHVRADSRWQKSN